MLADALTILSITLYIFVPSKHFQPVNNQKKNWTKEASGIRWHWPKHFECKNARDFLTDISQCPLNERVSYSRRRATLKVMVISNVLESRLSSWCYKMLQSSVSWPQRLSSRSKVTGKTGKLCWISSSCSSLSLVSSCIVRAGLKWGFVSSCASGNFVVYPSHMLEHLELCLDIFMKLDVQ